METSNLVYRVLTYFEQDSDIANGKNKPTACIITKLNYKNIVIICKVLVINIYEKWNFRR